MLKRRTDWLERLEFYVQRTSRDVFEWGSNDCALWAAGAIRAMTGTDPAASVRGAYTTREAARLLLISQGFENYEDFADSMFEAYGGPGLAEVGDLVLVEGDTFGIVQGRFAWALGLRGVTLIPMEHARRAWIIPKPGAPAPLQIEGPE